MPSLKTSPNPEKRLKKSRDKRNTSSPYLKLLTSGYIFRIKTLHSWRSTTMQWLTKENGVEGRVPAISITKWWEEHRGKTIGGSKKMITVKRGFYRVISVPIHRGWKGEWWKLYGDIVWMEDINGVMNGGYQTVRYPTSMGYRILGYPTGLRYHRERGKTVPLWMTFMYDLGFGNL